MLFDRQQPWDPEVSFYEVIVRMPEEDSSSTWMICHYPVRGVQRMLDLIQSLLSARGVDVSVTLQRRARIPATL